MQSGQSLGRPVHRGVDVAVQRRRGESARTSDAGETSAALDRVHTVWASRRLRNRTGAYQRPTIAPNMA